MTAKTTHDHAELLARLKGQNIITFDIETSPMLAYTFTARPDYIAPNQIVTPGGILCVAWQKIGQKTVHLLSEWKHGWLRMLDEIYEVLSTADALVTHNGSFDLGWLETEFQRAGLPPLPPVNHIDLHQQVGKKSKRPHKKLNTIVRELLGDMKLSHAGFDLWRDTLDGKRQAQTLMGRYCQHDVRITSALFLHLLASGRIKHTLDLSGGDAFSEHCTVCGSRDLSMRGEHRTATRAYPRFQCDGCGAWGYLTHTYRVTRKAARGLR